MADGRSKLSGGGDGVPSAVCGLSKVRPAVREDSPVGVDTTEELGAEVHVVKVAVDRRTQSAILTLPRRGDQIATYSTTWSQLHA